MLSSKKKNPFWKEQPFKVIRQSDEMAPFDQKKKEHFYYQLSLWGKQASRKETWPEGLSVLFILGEVNNEHSFSVTLHGMKWQYKRGNGRMEQGLFICNHIIQANWGMWVLLFVVVYVQNQVL